jgi:peptidoglycan/xylan/chitin deacetylase (PgdA/CDA1 family)
MTPRQSLPPALVISLDFELHWGVRDHCGPDSPYYRNLLRERDVVLQTLELFEEFGIAGTWATVGFLFAGSRAELDTFRPSVLPWYDNVSLFPYAQVVGDNELSDPLHYAASLVESIKAAPRQEIATHTYSHFFCTEAGQNVEQFRADIAAACAIAKARNVELRSIVFPRNQHNPDYDVVLREHRIIAYRGNPHSWMWRFADGEESEDLTKRAARLTDNYVSLTGDGAIAWQEVLQPSGLSNVRASYLLRPFVPALAALEPLRFRRLRRSIAAAARQKRILHLWWHPHNFGAYPQRSLAFLRRVLEEFVVYRDDYGMESLTMAEVADRARGFVHGSQLTPFATSEL